MAQATGAVVQSGTSPAKNIFHLAWPSVVDQVLQTIVQYTNAAMLGVLGASAMAAVAVNSSTIMLINGVMNALAVGFSVQIARHIGAGDAQKAKLIVRQAFISIIFFGSLSTIIMESLAGYLPSLMGADETVISNAIVYLRYMTAIYIFSIGIIVCSTMLRCAGDTKTPMFFNLLTNILVIIGNFFLIYPTRIVSILGQPLLIFGANMGVTGAGLATATANVVSGSLLMLTIFTKNSPIRITFRGNYRPNREILTNTFRIGLPSALERMTLSVGHIFITALVTSVGTVALAANMLAVTAEALCYLPAFGFSIAATTLVAQSLGAGQVDLADQYARLCTRYAIIVMTATGILMFIFSNQLMSIFTTDLEIIELGGKVLKIEALAEPFFAMSIVLFGVFRGAGDTKWPFYITVIGMWVVRLSIAFILIRYFHTGLVGAWIGMMVDLTTRGLLCFYRYKQGKWKYAWKEKRIESEPECGV